MLASNNHRCGRKATLICTIIFASLFTCSSSATQIDEAHSITGMVLDQAAAPIPKAQVKLYDGTVILAQTETDADGRFTIHTVRLGHATVVVAAVGFAEWKQKWNAPREKDLAITIVLQPAGLTEQVVVTATRIDTSLSDVAASIRVLPAADLKSTGALRLDDVLRQVPGFQLFRRSGSRSANPTSQGVSLRGLGASGASRSLVLADGIPLNDPFGGWVYWGRVPRESLSRVEVMRGAASDLYGSSALGGVIQLITKTIETPTLSFDASYGNQNTSSASLFMGTRRGRLSVSLAAESFRTDGYVIVAADERGPIDRPANSRDSTLDFKLQFEKTRSLKFFAGASYFGESRQNGTPFQTNRTHLRQIRLGGDWESQFGTFGSRVYSSPQLFDQNFSAVAADRSSETPTRIQRVPAQVTGFSLQWSRAFGTRNTIVAGIEAREVRGSSDEIAYIQGRPSSLIGAGGRQRDSAVYIKDILHLSPRVSIIGGARVDYWRNYLAHSDTRGLGMSSAATVQRFSDRSETAISPQLSLVFRADIKLSVFGSIYHGFRAPALNELYRSFRVGNIFTLANAALRAEKLNGVEGGLIFNSTDRRFALRGTLFRSVIDNSIANVTLSVTPDLITRQRLNLGTTQSQGFEVETDIRPDSHWNITGGYLFAAATVARFPGTPSLEGLAIPQVPRHSLAVQVRYTNTRRLTFGMQMRILGAQFDDDLNQFRLPGYFTVDATVSRPLSHNVDIYAAAENLFNQRYVVGRTPITTIGTPILLRAGFRFYLTRK